MRVFYVIHIAEPFIQAALNVVRYLSNPAVKHAAHITVRGPYDELQDVVELSSFIADKRIRIDGVSTFYGPSQNTVYLACDAPELAYVWWKPDYGFNPHLTLYDGDDVIFARQLEALMVRLQVRFSFRATELQTIISSGSPIASTERQRLRREDLAFVGGRCCLPLDNLDLQNLEVYQRLDYVAKIMSAVLAYSRQQEGRGRDKHSDMEEGCSGDATIAQWCAIPHRL